jgi:hypothetical protein
MSDSTDILEAPERATSQPAVPENVVEADRQKATHGAAPKPVALSRDIADEDIMMPLMAFFPEPPEGFDDEDLDEAG